MLTACSEPDRVDPARTAVEATSLAPVNERLSGITREHAERLPALASALKQATDAFIENPTIESKAAFQDAWLATHRELSRTLPLIQMLDQQAMLATIDTWPIEPGFLDSLPGYPESGIINDFTLTISEATLREQHGITDASEVSLGLHPLEYYAFVRPVEDFVPSQLESNDPDTADRRREVVSIIAGELVESIRLLGLALYPTPDGADSPPIFTLDNILSGTRRTAVNGFQQASLIVDADQGHCEYSQSSLEMLRLEVETLREIFAPGTSIMAILNEISPQTTQNLDTTLNQAIEVLAQEDMSEAERARLPLMLSAIGHQVEEFERALVSVR